MNLQKVFSNQARRERALLVGLRLTRKAEENVWESIKELGQLALTAGAEVQGEIIQVRDSPTAAFWIGKGKAEEVRDLCREKKINVVIFNDDLSSLQQRNLENIIGVKVIDRTQIILDIFAQRARSGEGKIEVELAQLYYRLPRLTGKGVLLSQLGGGIGTRGPGETKLEIDRRQVRERISRLEKGLKEICLHRAVQRQRRKEVGLPILTLVGYTNSGKSTLLNALVDAHIPVKDQLFTTLDPTIRRVFLPDHRPVLISDTVGFIRKLPHHLIAAFRATLEEVRLADLLLHVVDASHPQIESQIASVNEVLTELEVSSPIITIYNKCDLLPSIVVDNLLQHSSRAVAISALYKNNLDQLLEMIMLSLPDKWEKVVFTVPYQRGEIVKSLVRQGNIISKEYREEGIWVKAEVSSDEKAKIQEYLESKNQT
jgi:GTP-binding protein HflX